LDSGAAMQFIFVFILGVIVSLGLTGASEKKCIKFTLYTALGIGMVLLVNALLGTNLINLLLLELPSRSSTGIFLLYSALIGGLLRLIIVRLHNDKGDASL
jgi:hypothetical protein